uniref:Reverse transcriptase Ty1/copia-type domain-containing protein n=1 Tax=Solanum lycopersicum TaxID=4081 RepID=A0A3Q7I545_SOLLC
MEVSRTGNGLFLHQSKYARDLLQKAGLEKCPSQPTPMAVSSSTNGADTPFADITHFRSLIGALQYLDITHLDIQFAVNRVAQRMHQPSEHDYHCLKRILRYIFGTLDRGLLIRSGDLELRGFSDSDWANDKNDRKSTSGFLIFLGPNLISRCTKKQPKGVHLCRTRLGLMFIPDIPHICASLEQNPCVTLSCTLREKLMQIQLITVPPLTIFLFIMFHWPTCGKQSFSQPLWPVVMLRQEHP